MSQITLKPPAGTAPPYCNLPTWCVNKSIRKVSWFMILLLCNYKNFTKQLPHGNMKFRVTQFCVFRPWQLIFGSRTISYPLWGEDSVSSISVTLWHLLKNMNCLSPEAQTSPSALSGSAPHVIAWLTPAGSERALIIRQTSAETSSEQECIGMTNSSCNYGEENNYLKIDFGKNRGQESS